MRVIKEILTRLCSTYESDKHFETFQEVFGLLNKNGALKSSLIEQLKGLNATSIPEKDKYFTNELIKTWKHFHLRQHCEILQILLLLFHYDAKIDGEDVSLMLDIFVTHRFGQQPSDANSADENLVNSIGQLQSLIALYLLDLGSLALEGTVQAGENHAVWKNPSLVQNLDKIMISHLGNLKPHGPPMLGWMLSHYLVDQQVLNLKFKNLGERAFQLGVMEYLSQALKSDVCNSNSILSSICHGTIYSLLSILVTAFDPGRLANVQDLAIEVLREQVVANIVWKEGLDSNAGLSAYVGTLMTETQLDSLQTLKVLQHLAANSAKEVIHFVQDRNIFVEAVESVPTHFIDLRAANQVINLSPRQKSTIALPNGLVGTVSQDNKYYLWKTSYSGFKVFCHSIENLLQQVSHGAKNVSKDSLTIVTEILDLFDKLKSELKLLQALKPLCLQLIEKFIHVPNPPIQLLANCLKCLGALQDSSVWKTLTDAGLFPSLSASNRQVYPGVLGTLLVQQECVLGDYPLTQEFLNVLLAYPGFFKDSAAPCFVAEEILPSYQNWRFNRPLAKEQFGQLVLQVCLKFKVMVSLVKPLPNQTLVAIVSMGDRTIQSCHEAQTTSEKGLGVELSKLVQLGLELLTVVLEQVPVMNKSLLLSKVISSSEQPHFLLTVAHYIYHLQSPGLALTSIKFLTTVASLFPMSLLACLGQDAEALRDILIHRLESQTEATTMKLAILSFFTACVKSQPGLIQLLLSDANLLESVMTLLANAQDLQQDLLHLHLMEFIYSLWSHDCSLAVTKLKDGEDFWKIMTKPLFAPNNFLDVTKVNGFIFRIVSSEIFILKNNIDKSLLDILEKFFDGGNSSATLTKWCDFMVKNCSRCSSSDTSVLGQAHVTTDDLAIFLLGSWKTFLIVVSKEQPLTLSPHVCHLIVMAFIEAIRGQLVALEETNMKIVISLSETCLVLIQRWLTKCAGESMSTFVQTVGKMLEEFAGDYESLHPRARVAIQGVFATTLKLSTFKIESETTILGSWMSSACVLVEKALQKHEDAKEAILAVGLLRSLLQRPKSSDLKEYYGTLHKRSILMILLSYTHHALLNGADVQVIHSTFSLFLTLSREEEGVRSLLTLELSQLLWLPLSNINRKLDNDWIQVFNLALQLAMNILRMAKQHALEHILTVISLLQDQLMAFLSGPKNGDNLEKTKMELTATTANLISHVMTYYKQWQMIHPASLNQFFYAMNSLLHTCACLLIRPSLLNLMINQKHNLDGKMEELQRVRRLSSCGLDYGTETDSLNNETVHIQNRILETVSSCFKMLIALSPDLIALLTDDIIDHAAYEPLLQIGFSTPAFEQVFLNIFFTPCMSFCGDES